LSFSLTSTNTSVNTDSDLAELQTDTVPTTNQQRLTCRRCIHLTETSHKDITIASLCQIYQKPNNTQKTFRQYWEQACLPTEGRPPTNVWLFNYAHMTFFALAPWPWTDDFDFNTQPMGCEAQLAWKCPVFSTGNVDSEK